MTKKTILSIVGIIIVVAVIVGSWLYFNPLKQPEETAIPTVRIGFSMDSVSIERWKTDLALFTQRAEEMGAAVTTLIANGDDALQIAQIENMITQKMDVIVIVPRSPDAIVPVLKKAHEAGIKIISYDRLIAGSDIDLYISFDNVKVGVEQAKGVISVVNKGNFAYVGGSPSDNNALLLKEGSMSVLNPSIENGDIKIVFDKFTDNWTSDTAYKNLKEYLSTGATVDAVVAANDGTAYGAIRALQEKGLAGKIPVSGQDADLSACQRIVKGTQTLTVYKPLKSLAYKAAEMAISMAKNETIETTGTINNGTMDVPVYLLDVVSVTKDNMEETIIKDGFHTYKEVYGQAKTE
jgi:D-xylose transport system substrate-binding protein